MVRITGKYKNIVKFIREVGSVEYEGTEWEKGLEGLPEQEEGQVEYCLQEEGPAGFHATITDAPAVPCDTILTKLFTRFTHVTDAVVDVEDESMKPERYGIEVKWFNQDGREV